MALNLGRAGRSPAAATFILFRHPEGTSSPERTFRKTPRRQSAPTPSPVRGRGEHEGCCGKDEGCLTARGPFGMTEKGAGLITPANDDVCWIDEEKLAESRRKTAVATIKTLTARHCPLVVVLALFAATAFIVPALAPVATTDDWGYTRSVEILYHEGRLTVFPVVAATAVFQIGWGALFAVVFGMTLGVMRVATLAITGLGAVALYALLRELGVSRSRSALGTAAFLFNPLGFMMSYTFMTDS
jgi:hypothetical protein